MACRGGRGDKEAVTCGGGGGVKEAVACRGGRGVKNILIMAHYNAQYRLTA